jgi:hypothetical protein
VLVQVRLEREGLVAPGNQVLLNELRP